MILRLSVLALALAAVAPVAAQTAKPQAPAAKPQAQPAKAKDSLEAQFARQNLKRVLDTIDKAWFGAPYENIKAVDIDGSLTIQLSSAAVNSKVATATAGAVKVDATPSGPLNVKVKSTYFADANVRTELSGEFGNLFFYRRGNRGFIYSKELNAYSDKVAGPPPDAPLTFRPWFRQCLNDIEDVYIKGSVFKASMGKDDGALQTLVFISATGAYDPKKREQSLAESLGFWKRGRLEVTFDKASGQPQALSFRNEQQGVASRMTFSYGAGGRLASVTVENQSRGMEGPASLAISYGGDGLMSQIAGKMGFAAGTVTFDLGLKWSNDKTSSSISAIPPMGATKKGREEFDTMVLVGLAGKILGLQSKGLNLRSVSLGAK